MKRTQPLAFAVTASLAFCFATASTMAAEPAKTTETAKPAKKKSYKEKLFDDAESYDLEESVTKQQAEVVQMYPLATRVPPSQAGEPSVGKLRNQMVEALAAKKYEAANEAALKLFANPKANTHDKAESLFVQKKVVSDKDNNNHKDSIPLLEQILELNALDNNLHYALMSELAQRYLINLDYQDAFETSEKFLNETKAEKKEILSVKANSLYRLKRLPEAIAALNKVHAMDPENTAVTQMLIKAYSENKEPAKAAELAKTVVQTTGTDHVSRINLAITFFEAKQLAEAGDVIDGLRTANDLNDEHDYKTAMMVYNGMKNREGDLAEVVQEGLTKGVLKETASNYNVLGEAYYYSDAPDKIKKAIEAWSKAAPLAKDGVTYLNLAIVQCQEDMFQGCKESAKNALAKGGIAPGDAWLEIANAEQGLGNNAAAAEARRKSGK